MGPAAIMSHLPALVKAWKHHVTLDGDLSVKADFAKRLIWLEARIGLVGNMLMFLQACPGLVTQDAQKTVANVLIELVGQMPTLVGLPSKLTMRLINRIACLQGRLYKALQQVPLATLEASFAQLLPLLVSNIVLSESASSITTTTLLAAQCHSNDAVLLGFVEASDFALLEHQLQVHGGGGLGALEHDVLHNLYSSTDIQVRVSKGMGT